MQKIIVFVSGAAIALSSSACTTIGTVSPHVMSQVVAAGPRGQAVTLAGVDRAKVKLSPKSRVRLVTGASTSPWVPACSLQLNEQSVKIAGQMHDWRQVAAVQVKNADTGKTIAAIFGAIFVAAAVVGTVAAVSGKGKKRRVKSRSKRRRHARTHVRARAPAAARASARVRARPALGAKAPAPRPRLTTGRRSHPPRRRYAALGRTRHRHHHGVGVAIDIPLYLDDGIPPPPAAICEPGLPCAAPPLPPRVAQAVDMEGEAPTPPPPPPLHPLFSRRLCK